MTTLIERLRALYAKATPGEWFADDDGSNRFIFANVVSCAIIDFTGPAQIADCELVAQLHNAFPELAAEIERLQREVGEARKREGKLREAMIRALKALSTTERSEK